MGSHIGWALVALLVASGAPRAAELGDPAWQTQYQKPQVEPERKDQKSAGHQRTLWWKDEQARTEIGFTPEQAAEIDKIFKEYIDRARPLRDEVNILEKALSETMKARTAEVSDVAKQVDKVEHKRAELNKLRVVMLYRMHRVLTPEQNARLQAYLERREAARKKQDGDRGR